MPRLRDATIEALDQVRSLINSVKVEQDVAGNLYAVSGIGRHVRHVVDHFRALQAGIESGTVDYNIRHRESEMESQAELGLFEIDRLILWLQSSAPTDDSPVAVISEISCLHDESRRFDSNVRRELLYLINHSIHHAAYAALLARENGVKPDAGIGLAPATASYLRHDRAECA